MRPTGGIGRWRAMAGAAACLALSVLALLIWAKLKLVTGVPRTAYAEPKVVAPAEPPERATAQRPAAAKPSGRAAR